MEMSGGHGQEKFSSPEQELAYLREQVAVRERELASRGAEIRTEEVISDKVRDYHYVSPKQVLNDSYRMQKPALETLALNLSPEPHDAKMSELLGILNEKGIKNALSLVDEMNDAHVEDDFHRFL